MKRSWLLLLLLALTAVAGCADPTKGKPKAAVAAPTPEPAPPAQARRLVIADGSSIGFVGSKVTGSHDGGFHEFEGEIRLVGDDATQSVVSIVIDTTSLWADDERLTGHLKSPDFFAVDAHPTATFISTRIEKREAGGCIVTGNLTLHGITKSISFPAEISIAGDQATASAEFSIRRFDFDMKYPGRADDLIRDDVLIRLNVVARAAAEPADTVAM